MAGLESKTHRNMDVLDDNILVITPNTQALAFEHTGAANSDDALVGSDVQRRPSSIIIRARHPGAVVALVLDPSLAFRCAPLAGRCSSTAALSGRGAFGACEVPGAVDQDRTGSVVGDPLGESIIFSIDGYILQ